VETLLWLKILFIAHSPSYTTVYDNKTQHSAIQLNASVNSGRPTVTGLRRPFPERIQWSRIIDVLS